MGLFGVGKKKETSCCGGNSEPVQEIKATCGCGSECSISDIEVKNAQETEMSVKVLGSGCKKCNMLEDATKEAFAKLNIDIIVDHVTDFAQIAAYGVMSTPALVVNEKVVSMGKVLKVDEVVSIIERIRGEKDE